MLHSIYIDQGALDKVGRTAAEWKGVPIRVVQPRRYAGRYYDKANITTENKADQRGKPRVPPPTPEQRLQDELKDAANDGMDTFYILTHQSM